MSAARVLVDTNILVYAYDPAAGQRHDIAQQQLTTLWDSPVVPVVSVQVLQELYATLLRKKAPQGVAEKAVRLYLQWEVIENTRALLLEGIRLHRQHQLSFWDGLILAATKQAKAAELWSENFVAGQQYDGVTIVNPLTE